MTAQALSLFVGQQGMDLKKQLEVPRLECRFGIRERMTRIDHLR